ncbi:MAG: hypothetical protein LBP29_10050, partial [Treponema sp.]|nr:hypothetical protein [Treponema sp.]
MHDDVLAEALRDKEKKTRTGRTEVLSQEEIDLLLTAINADDDLPGSPRAEKRRFLAFADLAYAEDSLIRHIAGRVTVDELTKALIREDTVLRKAFYRNMPFDSLKSLDEKLKTLDSFEMKEKIAAQRKILALAAKAPAYAGFRVEDRFNSAEEFAAYLTWRRPPEEPYGHGIFEKDVTMCRFSDTKNGENLLADIGAVEQVKGKVRRCVLQQVGNQCWFWFHFFEQHIVEDARTFPLFAHHVPRASRQNLYALAAVKILDGVHGLGTAEKLRFCFRRSVRNHQGWEKIGPALGAEGAGVVTELIRRVLERRVRLRVEVILPEVLERKYVPAFRADGKIDKPDIRAGNRGVPHTVGFVFPL